VTAKLLVREVGQRDFVQHNGDFADAGLATTEGERLTKEGNVEAFQTWVLVTAKQRVWNVEDIPQ
jgi:hypothetical protein